MRSANPTADRVARQWRCLQSSIALAVAPFRNLTEDNEQQRLTDAFTDDLVTELIQHGRGFSLQGLAAAPAAAAVTAADFGREVVAIALNLAPAPFC